MSKPEDVLDIVALYLKENGYDGLYREESCACLLDDLATCGEIGGGCQPGYKVSCPGDDSCDCDGSDGCFHVGPYKEK